MHQKGLVHAPPYQISSYMDFSGITYNLRGKQCPDLYMFT